MCFGKKGGCGAKFAEDDAAIVNQPVGKVPNPDVADLVNTIDKMAQKRALIAATLIAVNASEFFTQDVEDMVVDAAYTVVEQATRVATPAQNGNGHSEQPPTTGKPNGNGDVFKRYAAAKEAAAKSGKFNGSKHLEQAWTKMFAEYKAGDAANGERFLSAWAEYVEAHEPAAKPNTADVPAMADVAEMVPA